MLLKISIPDCFLIILFLGALVGFRFLLIWTLAIYGAWHDLKKLEKEGQR